MGPPKDKACWVVKFRQRFAFLEKTREKRKKKKKARERNTQRTFRRQRISLVSIKKSPYCCPPPAFTVLCMHNRQKIGEMSFLRRTTKECKKVFSLHPLLERAKKIREDQLNGQIKTTLCNGLSKLVEKTSIDARLK